VARRFFGDDVMMDISDQIAELERKYPPVDIASPPGTRIVFHGCGGYSAQQKAAHDALVVGTTYIVVGSSIGNWETTFFLAGQDGGFNSSLFSPDGWLAPDEVAA
jgi:hypothetical protein